jgi:tRNA (cytidine/uridine-2'-O-)-methyltransferase
MQIVLFEPEIPPNTGNVARLSAATQVHLHLIEPLGFRIEDRYLKRAGLDYWSHVQLTVWPDFAAFLAQEQLAQSSPPRLVGTSARQGEPMHRFAFKPDDILFFGPETRGLPGEMLEKMRSVVRIPIQGEVRSLNLSTAVGIVLYQALAVSGELDRWEEAGQGDLRK